MNLDFNTYPLDILQTEGCREYLNEFILPRNDFNMEDAISQSIGSTILAICGGSTIVENVMYAIIDSGLKDKLAELVKELTDEIVDRNKDCLIVYRQYTIITYIVIEHYLGKQRPLSTGLRMWGRTLYLLIKKHSWSDAFTESIVTEVLKKDSLCNDICIVYNLAFLMQVLFSGKRIARFNSTETQQIHDLTYELLSNSDKSILRAKSPHLFKGEEMQCIEDYVYHNLDDIYHDVVTSHSSALKNLQELVDEFYKDVKEFENESCLSEE